MSPRRCWFTVAGNCGESVVIRGRIVSRSRGFVNVRLVPRTDVVLRTYMYQGPQLTYRVSSIHSEGLNKRVYSWRKQVTDNGVAGRGWVVMEC